MHQYEVVDLYVSILVRSLIRTPSFMVYHASNECSWPSLLHLLFPDITYFEDSQANGVKLGHATFMPQMLEPPDNLTFSLELQKFVSVTRTIFSHIRSGQFWQKNTVSLQQCYLLGALLSCKRTSKLKDTITFTKLIAQGLIFSSLNLLCSSCMFQREALSFLFHFFFCSLYVE